MKMGIDLVCNNPKTRDIAATIKARYISGITNFNPGSTGVLEKNDKVRYLTPRECFRLMGVKDEDFEKVAVNQSDSSLYHLAGDSIVVNVLMAIFKQML